MLKKIDFKFMTPEYKKAVADAAREDIATRGNVITTEKSAQNGDSVYSETFTDGLKTQVVTKKGDTITYSYDRNNQLLQECGPKRTIEYYYGKSGELGRSINTTTGSVSDYIYKDGVLTSIKTSIPFRKPTFTEITNDEFGRIIKSDNKWETTTYTYNDELRQVTIKTEPKNQKSDDKRPAKETTVVVTTYDEYGRVIEKNTNDKFFNTYEYTGYIESTDTSRIGKKPGITKYTQCNVTVGIEKN